MLREARKGVVEQYGEEGREAPQAALTSGDVASERSTSIQANEARMAEELTAIRARIEEIQATMTNDR